MRHKTESDAIATLRRFKQIRDVESYSIFQGSPGTDFPWHMSVTYMADGPFKGVI